MKRRLIAKKFTSLVGTENLWKSRAKCARARDNIERRWGIVQVDACQVWQDALPPSLLALYMPYAFLTFASYHVIKYFAFIFGAMMEPGLWELFFPENNNFFFFNKWNYLQQGYSFYVVKSTGWQLFILISKNWLSIFLIILYFEYLFM